jgi:cellulose biosynthesis protein BcsQ
MSVPVIAFFNNKGGVGKTSLVYHVAWMLADRGLRVIAADLDPQANLTAAFLDEDRLEELWPDGEHAKTSLEAVEPLLRSIGDVCAPHLELIDSDERLGLIVGDLGLSGFEDELSSQWPDCRDGKERAFRVMSALWRVMQQAAGRHEADLVLVDLGPNLGAINRAALISSTHVVIPLSPDLFSLEGLRNLGPTFHRWRREWQDRRARAPQRDFDLPPGDMHPIGYIVLQHSVRLDRPVKAYDRWIARIPGQYRESVLGEASPPAVSVVDDPHNLALLKHYRSLISLGQEARKPIFHLRAGNGAIGAHMSAVQDAYRHFKELAGKIAARAGVSLERLAFRLTP